MFEDLLKLGIFFGIVVALGFPIIYLTFVEKHAMRNPDWKN
jgi:hypothetical protein